MPDTYPFINYGKNHSFKKEKKKKERRKVKCLLRGRQARWGRRGERRECRRRGKEK